MTQGIQTLEDERSLPPKPPPIDPPLAPPAVPSTDYTKTKLFATTDLIVKIITALALAVLGYAGWSLQSGTEEHRRTAEADASILNLRKERSASAQRIRLPELQQLTEAENLLSRASRDLLYPKYEGSEAVKEARSASRLGSRLILLADGMSPLPGDPDTEVEISTAEELMADSLGLPNSRKRATLKTSLRTACLMYGEILRLLPFIQQSVGSGGLVRYSTHRLQLVDASNAVLAEAALDPQTDACWQQWLPSNSIPLAKLYTQTDLSQFADELHYAVARRVGVILANAPDLAERYVTVRENIIKNNDEPLTSPNGNSP
jgi:hypothetical protein